MTERAGADSIIDVDSTFAAAAGYLQAVIWLVGRRNKREGKTLRKWKALFIAGAMILSCAGCGEQKQEDTGAVDSKPVDVVQTEEAGQESAPTESETEEKNGSYENLEEKGAEGETAAFAEQIQAAMAAKDMDALAGLCAYPLAVNGEVVESAEALMALGADTVFTEERCAVIAAVDVSALEETMAGVIMGDATPNIIFKSADGELKITGIN